MTTMALTALISQANLHAQDQHTVPPQQHTNQPFEEQHALSCMLLLIIRNLLTSLAWLADNLSQQLLSFSSGLYRVDFAMPAATW